MENKAFSKRKLNFVIMFMNLKLHEWRIFMGMIQIIGSGFGSISKLYGHGSETIINVRF